jgi:uridine phosphorylase
MNKSRRIIHEYHFGCPSPIADKILFIKRDTRLDEYKRHLSDIVEFGKVWHGLTGTLAGTKVTIIVTGIGPSLVGDAVYALDKPGALCLYSGTCGGIDVDIQIGNYVLARQAVCADGYSFLYGYAPFTLLEANSETLDALRSSLSACVRAPKEGTVITTSSVVRENDLDFWDLIGPSGQAIEMGCASFYAAALHSQKRAAAYFWVTDLPTRGKSFYDIFSARELAVKQQRCAQTVSVDMQILASV